MELYCDYSATTPILPEVLVTMMPYLIGAVLIFAAVTIANIVYNFTSSFTQGA